LANELTTHLSDDLKKFVEDEKPVLGVCNGFQVLVRTGLLPFGNIGDQQATLSENEIGRFECRWIDLAVGQTVCRFVDPADFEEQLIPMQTAHGEGRFFADDKQVQDLSDAGQVVFRYAKPDLNPAEGEFPFSPNGSLDDIAGVCDPKGVVLGMMPHPERSVAAFHPHRRRTEAARTSANIIFRNIVRYAKES
jgi:phosphoribosylformylglycinamidine synthase